MPADWLTSPWLIPAAVGAGLLLLGLLALFLLTPVYKHVICLKYLFGGWKAVVPLISALPAALGVFLLVLVFAIMDGFANETREMTRGTLADIIIDAHMEGLPYYEEFVDRIQAVEGVEAATPVIQSYAIVRIKPRFASLKPMVRPPCLFIGIRPEEKARMGRFHQYLQRQEDPQYPAADLLKWPATARGPARVRPGCIAGVGLVGAPVTDHKVEIIDFSALVVLFWAVTALVWLVFVLVLYRTLRRHGRDTPGVWLAVLGAMHVLAVVAAVEAARAVAAALPDPAAEEVAPAPAYLAAGLWALVWLVAAALVFRSGPRRATWLKPAAALHLLLVLAAPLTFWSAGLHYGPREAVRSQVVDVPLVDYGGEVVVSTIPIRPSGALDVDSGGLPRVSTRAFTLVDTFKSGYWEADSSHLYVDFDVAQQMAGMDAQPANGEKPAVPARATQIQVKIKDPAQGDAVIARIQDAWAAFGRERPEVVGQQVAFNTWETQQRMILTVVKVERNITALMLGLMFVGFGVLIALISYVMAYIKSRDVGILKALGARDLGVGSLFLGYGFIIGLIGMVTGMAGAIGVLAYLDPIEIWVNATLGIDVFPREMYYFDHIPRNISVIWCVTVGVAVLVFSTLASVAGGLLAALKQPVETLRYE